MKDLLNGVAEDARMQNATGENVLNQGNKFEEGISIKSFRQLAKEGENLPDLKKVWGNNILEGNTVLFPSERGVGKTFLSLQIAIAVSGSMPYFLGEEITLHGNVLYINLELGERILTRRVNKLFVTVKENNENPYQVMALTTRKSISQFKPTLEKLISELKPVLVVIDNLRFAFSEKNNERNMEMTNVIKSLNQLRDRFKFALLLIHHTRKGASNQPTHSDLQSGAGAISDLVDSDFFLRLSQMDPNLRLLKREKSRNCEGQSQPKLLRLNPETLWFEIESNEVDEADHIFPIDSKQRRKAIQHEEAKILRKEGKTCQEIGDQLGVHKSTISRGLRM